MSFPETRPSLLIRIRDPQDGVAWSEFEQMYREVVVGMARSRGMQAADAEDLAQNVLWAISKGIARFDPEREDSKFRTWLKTVARRAIINALTRGPHAKTVDVADVAELLVRQPAADVATEELVLEYRREVFQAAAKSIQPDFDSDTWTVFWRTAVQGHSPATVAGEMSRSVGSVYTARSRVTAKLRAWVSELDLEQDADQ